MECEELGVHRSGTSVTARVLEGLGGGGTGGEM